MGSIDIMRTREDLFKKYLPRISGLNDIMGGLCKPQPGKYSLHNKVRNFESARAKALRVAHEASEGRKRKQEMMVMLDTPAHDPTRARSYKSNQSETNYNGRKSNKVNIKRKIIKGVVKTKDETLPIKSKEFLLEDTTSIPMMKDNIINKDDKAEYHEGTNVDDVTALKKNNEKSKETMETLESKIKTLQCEIRNFESPKRKRNDDDITENNEKIKQNTDYTSEGDIDHEDLNDEPYICVLTGEYSSPYPVVGGTSYENYIDQEVTADIVIPDALKGKPYKPTRLNNKIVFIAKGPESADEYKGEKRKCYLSPVCNIDWESGTRISKVVILEGEHSLLGMSVWACLHHGQASINGFTRQKQGVYWPYKYSNKYSNSKDEESRIATRQRRTKRRES